MCGRLWIGLCPPGLYRPINGGSPCLSFALQTLSQEGVAIIAFKLLKKGEFQERDISDILTAAGTP